MDYMTKTETILICNNFRPNGNYFGKITHLTRNSLKMSFFPGHFERTKFLKNYEKIILRELFFRNNFVSEGMMFWRACSLRFVFRRLR